MSGDCEMAHIPCIDESVPLADNGAITGAKVSKGFQEYVVVSKRLADSARQLRDNMGSKEAREFQLDELLALTRAPPITATLGFDSVRGTEAAGSMPEDPEASLAQALLDLQTANVLAAAEYATREPGSPTGPLDQATAQIARTRADLLETTALIQRFEASRSRSESLEQARATFRHDASELLDEIVRETGKTLASAGEAFREMVPEDVSKALDRLGEQVPWLQEGGRFVRKAIELVERAFESLVGLFGPETLARVKEELKRRWDAITGSDLPLTLLGAVLGADSVKAAIAQRLSAVSREPASIDAVREQLEPVAKRFNGQIKLVRGLIGAAGMLLGAASIFHLAAPPFIYALLAALVLLLAAGFILGLNYVGERRLLAWDQGVRQVVDTIAA